MKALRIFMMVALLVLPSFASQAMAQSITCPSGTYSYHENGGPHNTTNWTADATAGQTVADVVVSTPLAGVTATVVITSGQGTQTAEGYVEITVTDHCLTPGGNIELEAQTTAGNVTCTFNVTLTNTDPVITCPGDLTFDYTAGYTGLATATDADGDGFTFSKVSGPAGLSIDLNTGDITWTTVCGDVGVTNVVLEVTDDCSATHQCNFDLTVTNDPPTITCPGDVVVLFNVTMVSGDFVTNDPEGQPVTVTINATPAPTNAPTIVGNHVEWVPTLAEVGIVYTVELTPTDQCGLAGTQCTFTMEAVEDEWIITCTDLYNVQEYVGPGTAGKEIMQLSVTNAFGSTGDDHLKWIILTSECDDPDDADVSMVYFYRVGVVDPLHLPVPFVGRTATFDWTNEPSVPELLIADGATVDFLVVFDIASSIPEDHDGNVLDVKIAQDNIATRLDDVIGPSPDPCGEGIAPGFFALQIDAVAPQFAWTDIYLDNTDPPDDDVVFKLGSNYDLRVYDVTDNNSVPADVTVEANLERLGGDGSEAVAWVGPDYYQYIGSIPADGALITDGLDILANHVLSGAYILTITATDEYGNSRTVELDRHMNPFPSKPFDDIWPDVEVSDIEFELIDFGLDGVASVDDQIIMRVNMKLQPPYYDPLEILNTDWHTMALHNGVRIRDFADMNGLDPFNSLAYPIEFEDPDPRDEIWEYIFTVVDGNWDVEADDPLSIITITTEDNAGYWWPDLPSVVIDGNIRRIESDPLPFAIDNYEPQILASWIEYDLAPGGDHSCLDMINLGDEILIKVDLSANLDVLTSVTVDLMTSGLGGALDEPLYDDGTHGDDVADDYIYHLLWTIDPSLDPADGVDLPAGAHTLTVNVCDDGGNCNFATANVLNNRIVDTRMPTPLETLTAEALAGGEILLRWEPEPDDDADIKYYWIYCGEDAITNIDYTTDCGHQFGGTYEHNTGPLTDGTTYCFGIRCEDDACNMEENTHVVVCATADAVAPTAFFWWPHTCYKDPFEVIAKSDDLDIDEFMFAYREKGTIPWTNSPTGWVSAADMAGSDELNLGLNSGIFEVVVMAKDKAGNAQTVAEAYAAGQFIEIIWDVPADGTPWVEITEINGDHNPLGVVLIAGVNEMCIIAVDNLSTTFGVYLKLDDGAPPAEDFYLVAQDVPISLATPFCFEFSLANWVTTNCELTVKLVDCPGNEGTKVLPLTVQDVIPVECRMTKPTHLQAVPQTTALEVEVEYLGTTIAEVSLADFYYRETGVGAWVRFFSTTDPNPPMSNFFKGDWDNTGLAPGAYDLKAVLSDDAVPPNECHAAFVTVVIDVEGPSIALHIDGLMNVCGIDKICPDNDSIHIWAEVLDATMDIYQVEFFYKESSQPDFYYTPMGTGVPANNNTIFTLEIDISPAGLDWDDETSYDIKAVPTDAAGNEGDPSVVSIFLDCTAPDVAFTEVTTPSATFTNPSAKLGGSGEVYAAKGDEICMEVSVLNSEDICGLEKVEYYLDLCFGAAPCWEHIGTSTSPDDGFPICFEPLALGLIEDHELDDGHWTGDIKAVLYDSLGNPSEDIITLYILDVDPSQALIVEPENDSYVWGDVTLQSKALNAYEICEVCYWYRPEADPVWYPVLNGCSSTPDDSFKVVWHTLNTIADGVYYLRAVATDCDNNVDDDPPTIQVTVANELPTVTILDPSICFRECPDDPVVTIGFVGGKEELFSDDDKDVLVQATVSSPIPDFVTKVEFYVKSIFDPPSDYELVGTDLWPTNDVYDALWDACEWDDGRYHMKAKVYDAAGRSADSDPVEISVDCTDPLARIVSVNGETHPDGMDIALFDTLAIQVVAYDTLSDAGASRCYNSGVTKLGFQVSDAAYFDQGEWPLTELNWYTDFHDGDTLFYWNVSGLTPGTYYIYIVAEDCLGNWTSDWVEIHVYDHTPPLVTVGGFFYNPCTDQHFIYGYTCDEDLLWAKFEYRKIDGADTSAWLPTGEADFYSEFDGQSTKHCSFEDCQCCYRGFIQSVWDLSGSLVEGVSYQGRFLSTDYWGNRSVDYPETYAPIVNFTYEEGVIVPEQGPLGALSFEKNFDVGRMHGIVKQNVSEDGLTPQVFGVYLPDWGCGDSEIECVWMQQNLNYSTHFAGSFEAGIIWDGGSGTFFSSVTLAEDGIDPLETGEGQLYTYLKGGDILVVKVDKDLGTYTQYCTDEDVCVYIPGGAVSDDRHLVVWPEVMPPISLDQPTWIPVGDDNGFATYVGFTSSFESCFENGRYATIKINYSEALNVPAESLVVAWWNNATGQWSTDHLSWGSPYSEGFNTDQHYVEFVAECLEGPFAVIHLLERECEGSIVVRMRESDIVPYCNGYTDPMPTFTALITDNVQGPSAIEQASINFKLDLYESGELITIYDGGSLADDFDASYNTTSGIFKVGWIPGCLADELEEGDHIATVSAQNDNLNWCTRTLNFKVDATPPDVVWHPSWVSGEKPAFTFIITDDESGVNKDSIWIDIYDADESDQPYEKDRLLTIYPDGVDEFWTDDTTLYVELINPCDGQYIHVVIYDGKYDIEVVEVPFFGWVTERRYEYGGVRDCVGNKASAEHLVFPVDRVSPQCSFVTSTYANPVKILVTDPVDTVFHHTYKQGSGVDVNSFKITENGESVTSFTYNSATNILTYTPTVSGPITVEVTVMDMVGNEGGIEFNNWDDDTEGPEITWTSLTEKPIRIRITDAMSGVDWSTLKFYEDGDTVAVDPDTETGVILYTPVAGRIYVEIQVKDNAGNLGTKDFYTEAEFLMFTDPHNYPNPFDAREGRTTIDLGLSKDCYVTVKIYDFAGEFVTTIVSNQYVSTSEKLYWDGSTESGTDVANGTYLCYIKAKDSDGATKTAVIKITVLKQDK